MIHKAILSPILFLGAVWVTPVGINAQSPNLAYAAAGSPELGSADLLKIAGESKNVVVATVTSSKVDRGASGAVVTHVTFKVKETLNGHSEPIVTIDQPGGLFEGIDYRETGVRYFIVGETVVLAISDDQNASVARGVWDFSSAGIIALPAAEVDAIRTIAMRHGFLVPKVKGASLYELSVEDFKYLLQALKNEAMGIHQR